MVPQTQISVIIPSFNQAQYLEQTLLSIIDQNIENIEIIVVDGGSTDGSVEIIKQYEMQLAYWASEPDRGQSHAINKGFAIAKGDIIAWLNSDDLYLPDTFKTVIQIFQNNPAIDLIYGDVINFDEKGNETYYGVAEFEPYDFLTRISIHQPAVFWRRKILNESGVLDESLHYVMDYDYWMRVFFSYKTLKINKPLAKFRVHSTSKTSSNPPLMYLEWRKVLSRFICSVAHMEDIVYLKKLGIYDNDSNSIYHNIDFNYSKKRVIKNYIFQAAIQEYSFGSKKKADLLLLHSLLSLNCFRAFWFLIKNNTVKHLR
ncbi:MAG: glycosyltransferase family 2 protein [Salinivirgaceae bacterium]|jgi:glycosyltransferase involved in cell wall biosynthesis